MFNTGFWKLILSAPVKMADIISRKRFGDKSKCISLSVNIAVLRKHYQRF